MRDTPHTTDADSHMKKSTIMIGVASSFILVLVVFVFITYMWRPSTRETPVHTDTSAVKEARIDSSVMSTTSAAYGEKVTYAPHTLLQFPDFDLIYTGSVTKKVPFNDAISITVHYFQISRAGESKELTWSAGTGDIGPSLFEEGGRQFQLEVAYSDTLGSLSPNEIVVLPRLKK